MATKLLLLLVTACAAELGFQPKQQYEYAYEAKQASGIPGLDTQWSALGIKMNVFIQVPTADNLNVQLKDIKYGEAANMKVRQQWRHHINLDWQSDTQFTRFFTQPFKVVMSQGVVREIITESGEPTWIVNIKKSIAQMFQIDLKQQQSLETPGDPAPLSYSSQASGVTANMFRVMEKSIGGECETIYETSRPISSDIKANIIQELSLHRDPVVNVPSMARFKPFYVLKTKNYQNCRVRPVWQHMTPPAVACRSDDCHLTAANSSATIRYVLDGDTRDFGIQSVVAESETPISPFGHDTEQLWTVSNQTLYLIKRERMGSFMGKPRQPYVDRNLFFRYPTINGKPLQFPDLKSEPQISHVLPGIPINMIKKKMPVASLQPKIKELLRMVDQYLSQVPDPTREHVAGIIIELERGLGLLSYSEIKAVYQMVVGSPSQLSIFFDTLAVVGTNPAVSFIMEAITTLSPQYVKPLHAVTLISTLPMTIKTPTPEIMTAMVKFLKVLETAHFSPMEKELLRMTTALTLSNLFHQVCVSNVTVQFSYAQSMYDQPFCNEEMRTLITQNMIPYLDEEIKKHEEPVKLAYIQALGNIGHRAIIPVLQKLFISPHSTALLASKAIYALHYAALEYPEYVRRVLMPIFDDPMYPTEVRLAALTITLSTNPPIFYWQKIAVATWYEPSEQIVAFVHSAYTSLANNTMAQMQPLFEMSRRARITLPLVRPPPSGWIYSSSYSYVSRLISYYQVASIDQMSYITSPMSFVPSVFYTEFKQYINSLVQSTSKWVFNIKGVQSLIDRVVRNAESHSRDRSAASALLTSISKQLHVQALPQDSKFQASVYMQFMGAIDHFFTLSERQMEDLITKFKAGYTYSTRQIQKMIYLEDKTVTILLETGIPFNYVKKVPVVASVRGDISVQYSYNTGKYSIVMKDVKPFVVTKNRVMVATVSPWSLRLLGAGVENNFQMSLPVTYQAQLDTQHKQVDISVTLPTKVPTIKLAHLQTMPFTTAVNVNDYVQMTTDPKTVPIRPGEQSTIKIPFGNWMGIKGYVQLVSGYKIFNFNTMYREFIKRGSIRNQFSFWYLMGSLHPRHYDIYVDVPGSELQRLQATVTYGEKRNSRSTPNPSTIIPSPQHYQQVTAAISSVKQILTQVQRKINTEEYNYGWTATATTVQRDGKQLHYHIELAVGADAGWYKQALVFRGQTTTGRASLITHLQYPALSESRQTLISRNVQMPISAELGFGERSYNEHTIIMQGVVRRDTRAQEYSRNCPEARRCKVHEGIGHPNSADCRIAKDHATMANVYQMGFTLNNLPLRFRNSSYSLDYISKYLLWPYMSNDPYRPSSNPHALNITVRIDPTTNTASAHVQKPFELTKFEQILLPFNVLYPPYVFSLRKSASKKVVDSLFGVDKTTCIADPKMIKTFDNMTLPRQPSTACWTLLTKDSTGVMKVAILEKHISGKPAVRILANHMDVQVSLDSSGSGFLVQPAGSSPVRVVRYQPVVLPHGQYPLVRVEQYADDHVEILLPEHYIRVRLSHEAVKVYAAQTVYRNKLIGVCGNMDSELRDEMRGPQGCILSRREQFLTSYIVALGREPSCHPVLPSPSTCVRSYLEQSIRSVHTY